MIILTKAKQIVKHICHWILPLGIQNLVQSTYLDLKRNNRFSTNKLDILKANRALRDKHSGERCFILCTGPSINTQDLIPLKDEICIAVSNFFVHPDYHIIKPKYYCIAPYHLPITEEAFQFWLDDLSDGVGETTMFFSLGDQNRINMKSRFPLNTLHYLNFSGDWNSIYKTGFDLEKPLPPPQSVPNMALLIALYMGFKEIFLLGCDHDWILHLNESIHFYDESKHTLNRNGYNEWSESNFEIQLNCYLRLWKNYKIINQLALRESKFIFNSTPGGLLDIFPRIALEEALQ